MIQISYPMGEETVVTYHTEKYTRGDYYSQGHTIQGHWFGNEAARLGLGMDVTTHDFARIMGGRRPDARFDKKDLGNWEREEERFVLRAKAGHNMTEFRQKADVNVSLTGLHPEVASVQITKDGWVNSLQPDKRFKSVEAAQHSAFRELIGQEIYYSKEERSRRAWDIVSRPDKTVSLAAVVGGDQRIFEAHRKANTAMLKAIEKMIYAHGGGNNPPIYTGAMICARFEHLTARPEEIEAETGEKILYPAALLHTHNVIANWTRGPDGKVRALQTSEMFEYQKVAKAVYQAHMARYLRECGYLTEPGKNGSTRIVGYTDEYIQSESARSRVIQAQLSALGLDGARAADIVAKQSRNEKLTLTPEEVQALHKANDAAHGSQNERIISESIERAANQEIAQKVSAEEAVTKAKRSLAYHLAAFEHADLVTKALEYGDGYVLEDEIERNIAERTQTDEQMEQGIRADFMPISHGPNPLKRVYTTDIQHGYETRLCELIVEGRGIETPLRQSITKEEIAERLQWPVLPDGERTIERMRETLAKQGVALEERLAASPGDEHDPYYELYFRDRERPEDMAVYEHPELQARKWRQVEQMQAEFEEWRAEQVLFDEKALRGIEARLAQLDDLSDIAMKGRLQVKIELGNRFEELASGQFKPHAEQIEAAYTVLTSRDRHTAILGAAGAGKTTVLQAIQQVVREEGFRVVGVAATAKAVEKMEANGIKAVTLQGFLVANNPETIAYVRERLGQFADRIHQDEERLANARKRLALYEDRLAEAVKRRRRAEERLAWVQRQASERPRCRSIRAVIEREKRREFYRAEIPKHADRVRKAEEWEATLRGWITKLQERTPILEQRIAAIEEKRHGLESSMNERGVDFGGKPRYIFMDEASMAATRQCVELFENSTDRVLVVGDTGQHESIEAARAFDLMLQAGMRRGEIFNIVRQKNEDIRQAVEKCHFGKHHRALDQLSAKGMVRQIRRRSERLEYLAARHLEHPEDSLVLVADNRTKLDLNAAIQGARRQAGLVGEDRLKGTILVSRQDLTDVDLEIAGRFEVGNVFRLRKSDEKTALEPGVYWNVAARDTRANTLSVYRTTDAGFIEKCTVNPAALRGLEVYEKEQREFSVGDKILFKRKLPGTQIHNGTIATVTAIDAVAHRMSLRVQKDGSELTVEVPPKELASFPHIDLGYATTSFSVQGDTAGYTYAHFDTADKAARRLISKAMFYVMISRPKYGLEVVTNDPAKLRTLLMRNKEKTMATSPDERAEYRRMEPQQGMGMSA